MKLTPVEILRHLGFDVPEEGVDINPFDGYHHANLLRLIGSTMSINSITDSDLTSHHNTLRFLGGAGEKEPDAYALSILRASIGATLKLSYGMKNVEGVISQECMSADS